MSRVENGRLRDCGGVTEGPTKRQRMILVETTKNKNACAHFLSSENSEELYSRIPVVLRRLDDNYHVVYRAQDK